MQITLFSTTFLFVVIVLQVQSKVTVDSCYRSPVVIALQDQSFLVAVNQTYGKIYSSTQQLIAQWNNVNNDTDSSLFLVGLKQQLGFVSIHQNKNQTGIIGDIYDNYGVFIETRFQVYVGFSVSVSAAILSNSNDTILLSWSTSSNISQNVLYGKLIDNAGQEVGNFQLNSSSSISQKNLISVTSDRFLVVWQDQVQTWGQLFNTAGEVVGSEIPLNGTKVAALTNGRFVNAWKYESILYQIFDENGAVVVPSTALRNYTFFWGVTALGSDFILYWEITYCAGGYHTAGHEHCVVEHAVIFQLFDFNGIPKTGADVIITWNYDSTGAPDYVCDSGPNGFGQVAALNSSSFVVIWTDYGALAWYYYSTCPPAAAEIWTNALAGYATSQTSPSVCRYGSPSATPSRSPSTSVSRAPTPSVSRSASPSSTPSISPSIVPSLSPTSSARIPLSPSVTPSFSTTSSSPTSGLISPSVSITSTVSPSASVTPSSSTPSNTPAVSTTPTGTPSVELSPLPSPTSTHTDANHNSSNKSLALGLGIGLGVPTLLVTGAFVAVWLTRNKSKNANDHHTLELLSHE